MHETYIALVAIIAKNAIYLLGIAVSLGIDFIVPTMEVIATTASPVTNWLGLSVVVLDRHVTLNGVNLTDLLQIGVLVLSLIMIFANMKKDLLGKKKDKDE